MIYTYTCLVIGILFIFASQMHFLWFAVRYLLIELFPGRTSTREGEVVVPLRIVDDKVLGDILVGTSKDGQKKQLLTVAFDTLSGEFWLASIKACPELDCKNQPFKGFDGLQSKTYTTSDKPFYSSFGDTKVSGLLSKDCYTLGKEENQVVVRRQKFGEISSFEGISPTLDGMLGLKLTTTSKYQSEPVWAMATQLKISHEFGFYIHRKRKGKENGRLIFGSKDEGLMEKKLGSHPVVQKESRFNGWNIQIDKILIEWKNGKTEELELSTKIATPVPSVNTITLPVEDSHILNKKIFDHAEFEYNDDYNFNCNNFWEALPAVIIVMKGNKYRMDPNDYIIDYPSHAVKHTCGTGFTSGSTDSVILGRPFMKKFYTKYNIDKKTVNFSLARQEIGLEKFLVVNMFSKERVL